MASGDLELVQRPNNTVETKITSYDQVSSGLSAGVALFGLMAGMLVLIWVCSLTPERFVIPPIPIPSGETSNPEGVAEDIEPPGDEENPEIQEPALAEALVALDIMSTVQANEDTVSGNAPQMGKGSGLGDRREKGFGGGTGPKSSPWDKWEIRYSLSSMQSYAQQLDGLKVQLGAAIRKGDSIIYCTNVSAGKANVTEGRKAIERRLFFVHSIPRLRAWDKQLLRTAGVSDVGQRVAVQFYPQSIITQMLTDEATEVQRKGREMAHVKKTIFEVEGSSGNYSMKLKSVQFNQ